MQKVLFFNGQSPKLGDMFAAAAPEGFAALVYPSTLPAADKLAAIREADFLVLHPAEVEREALAAGGKLKLIQLLSAGYDKIDLPLAAKLGVPVATNGGANAISVAEHAVALLLALYKRLLQCDASVRAGTWREPVDGFNSYEVAGKTVGILGAGNIGGKVARRLAGFEAEILYCNPTPSPALENELGARRATLDEVLRNADIISLHMPLLPDTRSLLGPAQFALMKKNAVIINTSRAEIIDEAALLAALRDGRIAGAGLDVFHQEPLAVGHPLAQLDKVVLSPHSAGHAYESWARRVQGAWDNIRAVADGETPRFVVEAAAHA